MCLTIRARKPIKAAKDLHCFKNLTKNGSIYRTPTFGQEVVFHNGYFVQSVDHFGINNYYDPFEKKYIIDINEGVHSFYRKKCEWDKCTSFHAIIPKGTLVYFNDYAFSPLTEVNPIVSIKLIIFKTYFHYLMYKLGWLKVE